MFLDSTLVKECKLERSECSTRTSPTTSSPFPCFHLPQLNDVTLNESCVQGDSYDYFYNSEASYILTFIFVGTFMIGKL